MEWSGLQGVQATCDPMGVPAVLPASTGTKKEATARRRPVGRRSRGEGVMVRLLPHLLLLLTTTTGGEEGGSLGGEHHHRRHRHHRHDVHLAGFFPTSRGDQQSMVGQGVMPAVRLALRDVNRSPHILKNIHLRMHWNNTAVSRPTV